jgi:hypothetical protein
MLDDDEREVEVGDDLELLLTDEGVESIAAASTCGLQVPHLPQCGFDARHVSLDLREVVQK